MTKFLTEGNVIAVAVPSSTTWAVDQAILLGGNGGKLAIVEATNNQNTVTTAIGPGVQTGYAGDIATLRLNGVIQGLPKSTATGSGGVQMANAYWDPALSKITADGTVTNATLVGRFWATCLDATTTCTVKLNEN
jgi:hypothetical protein